MKLTIISDIHGNYVALEAVMDDIERQNVDQIVCLGDVVAFGPEPKKSLNAIRDLNCPVIMGNTDAWILEPPSMDNAEGKMKNFAESIHWCIEQLAPDEIEFFKSFAPTKTLKLNGSDELLCFHGSPNSFNDIIFSATPESELQEMISGTSQKYLTGGHTHVQMLRRIGDRSIINPGSIGLSANRTPVEGEPRRLPVAQYAIVSSTGDGGGIEFRDVPLDVPAVILSAAQSELPYKEDWIKNWEELST